MGIDLPPLVLAAEAFGRSAAPWLIVPFVVCAYAEEHLANGYVVMIQSNGEDAKVLALKFILVATALSLRTAVAMSVCILLVCALLCRGTLDAAYMTSLASAGVRVLTDSMAINYAGAILVGMLRVVAIGAASLCLDCPLEARRGARYSHDMAHAVLYPRNDGYRWSIGNSRYAAGEAGETRI